MFSSRSFIVSGLTFKSLIHFKLLFMRDVRQWSSFILVCECLIFPTPFIDKTILFPLSILGSFVNYKRIVICVGLFLRLQIVFHWLMCLFVCWFHTVLIIIALEYHLKSRSIMPPALFFFLRIPFLIQGLWSFHRNFRMVLTFSVKNTIGVLIGISKNLQISLGSIVLATFHMFSSHIQLVATITGCTVREHSVFTEISTRHHRAKCTDGNAFLIFLENLIC